ncbi:MAG: hypothetical protein EOM12_03775 [Verrucomicrobiae bacterium]|nr:hypothetical protein [Verrucomicrobiae bacterium]
MFDAGAIVGRMVLDVGKWNSAVNKVKTQVQEMKQETSEMGKKLGSALETVNIHALYVADAFKKMGNELVGVGRQVTRMGTQLAMNGAILLSPFILALKNVSKENALLKAKIDELGASFRKIQIELAVQLVPWLDKLNLAMSSLAQWLSQGAPALKNFVSQLVIASGVFLVIVGVLEIFAGRVIFLVGAFAKLGGAIAALCANPLGLLLVTLATVTIAVILLKDKVDSLKNAFFSLPTAMGGFFGMGMALGKSAGTSIGKELDAWEEKMRAFKDLIPDTKTKFDELINSLTNNMNLATTNIGRFTAGLKLGMAEAINSFADFGKLGQEIAHRTATAMNNFFSDIFFNSMTFQFQNLKQTMQDFGNAFIRMLADIMARIVMYFMVIVPLISAFPALAPALMVPIPGFQDGTDEVPSTGLYRLHGGETVTPKYNAGKSGKTALTIYNLISPEAVAAAMQSKSGQDVIVNTINANSLRNGVIRKEVMNR